MLALLAPARADGSAPALAVGSVVIVNGAFVSRVLAQEPPSAIVTDALAKLRQLGIEPCSVYQVGLTTDPTTRVTYHTISVVPFDAANPLYHTGAGTQIFFATDDLLRDSFLVAGSAPHPIASSESAATRPWRETGRVYPGTQKFETATAANPVNDLHAAVIYGDNAHLMAKAVYQQLWTTSFQDWVNDDFVSYLSNDPASGNRVGLWTDGSITTTSDGGKTWTDRGPLSAMPSWDPTITYFQNPSLLYGPRPVNGKFSWSNGARLYCYLQCQHAVGHEPLNPKMLPNNQQVVGYYQQPEFAVCLHSDDDGATWSTPTEVITFPEDFWWYQPVSLTNGSATVVADPATGPHFTQWCSPGVTLIFTCQPGVIYTIAAVNSDGVLTLTSPYTGPTVTSTTPVTYNGVATVPSVMLRSSLADEPHFAIDTNPTSPRFGTVYAVHENFAWYFGAAGQFSPTGVHFALSSDGGVTWKAAPGAAAGTEALMLPADGVAVSASVQSLCVAPDGTVYVLVVYISPGVSDDPVPDLANPADLAGDAPPQLIPGGLQGNYLAVMKSIDGGTSWSDLTTVADVSGHPIAYYSPFYWYTASVFQGFASPSLWGTTLYSNFEPNVIADPLDPSGRTIMIVVAESRLDNESSGVTILSSTDGGASWGPKKFISTLDQGDAFHPSVSAAPNGRIDVGWYGCTLNPNGVGATSFGVGDATVDQYYARRHPLTGTWSYPEKVSTVSSDSQGFKPLWVYSGYWFANFQYGLDDDLSHISRSISSSNGHAMVAWIDARTGGSTYAIEAFSQFLEGLGPDPGPLPPLSAQRNPGFGASDIYVARTDVGLDVDRGDAPSERRVSDLEDAPGGSAHPAAAGESAPRTLAGKSGRCDPAR
jgi:hypothetical protein